MNFVEQRNRSAWQRWFVLAFAVIAIATMASAQQASAQSTYPPIDRPWGAADYVVLAEGIKSGKMTLPVLSDPATKAVFERIVSPNNVFLSAARTRTLPVEGLLMEMSGSTNALVQILFTYMAKGPEREAELAKLQVYLLAIAGSTAPLMDEMVAKLPKDATYDRRMAGYQQAKSGVRQMVTGIVQSIGETHFFSRASTLEMARGTLTNLPGLQRALTPEDRVYLGERLGTQIAATSDPELKVALMGLQTAIVNGK